jgi:hypothetical protein
MKKLTHHHKTFKVGHKIVLAISDAWQKDLKEGRWHQGPVVGPYLHIVVVVTIYPLAHR